MTPTQRDWAQIRFNVHSLSNRPGHLSQPGGALNANYTQVDAVAEISNRCGQLGLIYNVHFTWETCSGDHVILRVKDQENITMLGLSA